MSFKSLDQQFKKLQRINFYLVLTSQHLITQQQDQIFERCLKCLTHFECLNLKKDFQENLDKQLQLTKKWF
ncbi:unnamed protein product [Paramecium octaurelia]|uniref:Uncharacterized protein n=1 Tax=Paramecium octaurelia TaxID=43137 RepID=A0A8S1TKK5_PAROT|nr:unnamed protein product [Paramecium octaurelia]